MGRLNLILHRLQHAARQSAPIAQSHDFRSGLRVSLRFENGRTYIYLSRCNTVPSVTEFDTIMRFYAGVKPASVLVREPKLQPAEDGRRYLVADWNDARDCVRPQVQIEHAVAF